MKTKNSILSIAGIVFSFVLSVGFTAQAGIWNKTIPTPCMTPSTELECYTDGAMTPDCFSSFECCMACSGRTGTCTVESINSPIMNELFSEFEYDLIGPVTSCADSASATDRLVCYHDRCPVGLSSALFDGGICTVRKINPVDMNEVFFNSGFWDASEDKCIKCSGVFERVANGNCGNAANIFLNNAGNCSGNGDGQLESACGTTDTACDEIAGPVAGVGTSCTNGLACEFTGVNCRGGVDACDVNGHCCIDPNIIDPVTGNCVGAVACNCGADGCCNGIGCVATGGDPDCNCVADFGGTNCGLAGSCDVATGSSQIINHNGFGVCCTGACAGGCTYFCPTGLCFLSLANATKIIGTDCCDGTDCYECDSGFLWDGVLNACMPLGGGVPSMGHSTDHGNYFKYDKDIDLVFTEGAEFLLTIAGGLALFVLILGGVYYMVSGSNPDGQTKAKKVVTYTVIGLAIILISYIIIMVVESISV